MAKSKLVAQYAILKQEDSNLDGPGVTYTVLLKAEDGTIEQQKYFVKEGEVADDVLSDAANHFNDELKAAQEAQLVEVAQVAEPVTYDFVNAS